MSNVKNLFVDRNEKNVTLIHSYNNGKISFELTDSTFNKIKKSEEPFDFITWEYLITFKSNDAFSSLYRDGQNLALGIISINGTTPYRFLKIGSIFNNQNETFFAFREINDKGYFFSINKKESKFGVTIVSQKGIVSRNTYDAPIKLTKNFDNTEFDVNTATNPIYFSSIENDKPQNITLTKERSKSFLMDNKLYFGFRGKSEKDDSACIKFLTFDLTNNSFGYKEIANSFISHSSTGIDDINYTLLDNKVYTINYTMLDNKIYFAHVTPSKFSIVILDATNFSELFRYTTSTYDEKKLPVKKLYIDGDNNITGNDYFSTDTIIPSKQEFLGTLVNKKKKMPTTEYTTAIAANKQAGNTILSLGTTRTTYFKVYVGAPGGLFGVIRDAINAPMGSVDIPTNYNFNKLLLPYFSKDKGYNFQSMQFSLNLDLENNIIENEKQDDSNLIIRYNLKNILQNGITIKDIGVYKMNNELYFSIINSKKNKVEIYKLTPPQN